MSSVAMSMNRSSEDNNKKATMAYLSYNRRISENISEDLWAIHHGNIQKQFKSSKISLPNQ